MKKKRFLPVLLCALLVLGMIPVTALADNTQQPEKAKSCTCEALCTEDSINAECPLCGAEGSDLANCLGKKADEPEAGEGTAGLTPEQAEPAEEADAAVAEVQAQIDALPPAEELMRLWISAARPEPQMRKENLSLRMCPPANGR